MITEAQLSDIPTLIEAMKGLEVVGGGQDAEGDIHFELSDGRYLVITGAFVIGLCRVHQTSLN